jgi:hypothetical protein
MWLVSHREFDQASLLEILLLLGDDATLDFETATIEEKREDGIVKVSLTELKDI